MIKRYLGLLLVIVLFISLTSCSGGKTKGKTDQYGNDEDDIIGITIKGETLEVVITYPREKAIVFEEVVADFEDITGAIAEITAYHNDYENKLQARMAANSLPDIFHAHGWSILDYREYFKEYFADLQNESWVGLYTDSALEVTRDDDGSVYVLMISQQANATLVNLDVCAKAGVDPYLIYDWDDFTDACQRIMDAGFTPIAAAAGNPGTLTNIAGSWLNYKGVPVDETVPMLDGTYDWESYRAGPLTCLADWMDRGFYVDDATTVAEADLQERFANNEIAFYLGNDLSWLIDAKELNEGGNFAFIPIFAANEDSDRFVGIGEGDAFGIWKDSPNIKPAKFFLDYLTEPEVSAKINNATGMVGAISTVIENDDGYTQQLFSDMQQKYPDAYYENLWDRKYMPPGMWQAFSNASMMLFRNHTEEGVETAKEYLYRNYMNLHGSNR